LMQYDSMMPCNMSVLYVSHQKKKLAQYIDSVRVVGGKTHLSPESVLTRQPYAIVVSVPAEKHNIHI
jgi:hypothetical protein